MNLKKMKKIKRYWKKLNKFYLWNGIAALLLLISIYGYYESTALILSQEIQEPMTLLINELSKAMILSILIGWVAGNILSKASVFKKAK